SFAVRLGHLRTQGLTAREQIESLRKRTVNSERKCEGLRHRIKKSRISWEKPVRHWRNLLKKRVYRALRPRYLQMQSRVRRLSSLVVISCMQTCNHLVWISSNT